MMLKLRIRSRGTTRPCYRSPAYHRAMATRTVRRRRRTAAAKADTGKRALVLCGGGITGLAYEIGALRALDDLLVDLTVNDFDIYVGTSAGSIVGALLANGVSPAAMAMGLAGTTRDLRPPTQLALYRPN